MLQEKWVEAVGLRKLQNGEAWGEVYMEMQVGFRRGGSLTSETNCPFKALVQVKLYIKEKLLSALDSFNLTCSNDQILLQPWDFSSLCKTGGKKEGGLGDHDVTELRLKECFIL